MQAEFHHFQSSSPFALELGGELPVLDLAYQTWGKLNAKKIMSSGFATPSPEVTMWRNGGKDSWGQESSLIPRIT